MSEHNLYEHEQALESLLESAVESEFYDERLGTDTSYHELPYTDPDLLIDDSERLLTADAYRINLSGGTTGNPKVIYKSEAYSERNTEAFVSILKTWDDGWEDKTIAILQPFGPWGIGHEYLRAFKRVGALSVPLGISLTDETELAVLQEMEPDIVCATPSKVVSLINSGFTRQLESVILAGEKPTSDQRNRIRDVLSARIHQFYGSEEMDVIGYSCPEQSIHIWSDKYIYEIDGGEEGELVLTDLYNHTQPLIKYRLGDRVRVRDCPCGRDDPAIEILGRNDTIVLRDGTNVSQRQLDEALDAVSDLTEYQVAVKRKGDRDVLELLVDWGGDEPNRDELVAAVSNTSIDLNSSLQQVDIELTVTATDSDSFYRTTRGKVPALIDQR